MNKPTLELVTAMPPKGLISLKHCLVQMCQKRTVPSSDAETNVRPSMEHANAVTALVCPSKLTNDDDEAVPVPYADRERLLSSVMAMWAWAAEIAMALAEILTYVIQIIKENKFKKYIT